MPKAQPFLPRLGQGPNWPCLPTSAMPQSAVAAINRKPNRKGTGRTGRQISYKIARARFNESATAAMECIFVTARQFPAITPRIPACATPQPVSAVLNPKLNRKDFRSFRSKISYKIHCGSYNKTAKKLNPVTALRSGATISRSAQIAAHPPTPEQSDHHWTTSMNGLYRRACFQSAAMRTMRTTLATKKSCSDTTLFVCETCLYFRLKNCCRPAPCLPYSEKPSCDQLSRPARIQSSDQLPHSCQNTSVRHTP